MSTGSNQPPGWYHAQGDPPGTQRYWDGAHWVGGPQMVTGGRSPDAGGVPGRAGGSGAFPFAEPATRILARLIDVVVMLVAALVIASIAGVDNQIEIQLFFAAAGVLYEVAFTALKGATPGKMAMGIGVVTTAGKSPPGWGPAVIRWAVTAIPCIGFVVFIVSLVWLFTDAQHRTVGDRAAGTFVVKTK